MVITYTWIIVSALIFLGVISGFISVLAGGGVTVILPMLLAIGLSSPMANGTSRVSLTVGALLATYFLHRKQAIHWNKIWPLFLISAIGSLSGAYFASCFSIAITSDIILITCIASLILISSKPNQWLMPPNSDSPNLKTPVWFYFLYFGLCFYGGIIAVDSAIIRLAALVLLVGLPLSEANVIKVVTGLPLFLISASVYFMRGEVDYKSALCLSIGTIVGALVATRLINNPKMLKFAYFLLFFVVILGTIYLIFLNEAFFNNLIHWVRYD